MRLLVALAVVAVAFASPAAAAEDASFEAGFAKVDVSPAEPVRLSGYGNRDHASEGSDTPLLVRAMALKAAGGETFVLVSFDTIGTPAAFTDDVARRLKVKYGVACERFVLCCTHSHTSPHLANGLSNLFAVPMSEAEQQAAERYTARAKDAIVEVVGKAIGDLKPGKLSVGSGKAGFAVNRRVVKDGKYVGFGVVPEGAVDHTVGVLKVTGADGSVRGVVFNYACHATTLEGNYYRVNGDWPEYAARDLEEANPGLVALCTIGCGADANPEPRGGPRAREHAEAHGREIAAEVGRVLGQSLAPVMAAPVASFGFAGLPFDRPTREQLEAKLKDKSPQVARHAANMLAIWERMGRLPETYPMPIETWKFGGDLTMVFLGGEVVIDYATRLKKEIDTKFLWATAYANDVFAYVASDRVRHEGGYEADYSMIYYNQPGPWAEGTEDLLVRRIEEVLKNPAGEPALSPKDAKQSFHLPPGFEIDLVASEPLITDPVNFAFGHDGRLWVAEMGDYPRGEDDRGSPGGRIVVLTDNNRDGVFDESAVFLDGLSFPNGVMPWRDGALVSCAPDVFFAKDTDGDGKADMRDVLLTGFPESNPQHRVNGFSFGLDNLVHLAHGANDISSPKTGKTYDLSGRDFALNPDTGEVIATGGDSQYGRCRTDFDDWFGNDNSNPLFQYVLEDRYLKRNPYVALPNPKRNVVPGEEYAVHPASRTVDRFNDTWAANRFTSACSPTVFRDTSFGEKLDGAAFVCEPVHNLVRCERLIPDGVTFRTERFPAGDAEFLASTDPWCRPVRVATGPDGGLWVADMYRLVIEHPQWIPDAWQARLDLRAGADKGRIWRVRRSDQNPTELSDLTKLSAADLVAKLDDRSGAVRDLAQQVLIWRSDNAVVPGLRMLAREAESPAGRVQALSTLAGLNALDVETAKTGLSDKDPRVIRFAVQAGESLLSDNPALGEAIGALAMNDDLRVRVQVALSLGEWDDPRAGEALGKLAAGATDVWLRAAVLSSAPKHADRMLAAVLNATSPGAKNVAAGLVATALGVDPQNGPRRILDALNRGKAVPDWQFAAVTSVAETVQESDRAEFAAHPAVARTLEAARKRASDANAKPDARRSAVALLGGPFGTDTDRESLVGLLTPQTPPEVQDAVVESLAKSGAPDVPGRLLAGWVSYPPRLRGVILQSLLARPAWSAALLDAAAAGTLAAGDFDAAARERLLASADSSVQSRAAKFFGSPVSSNRAEVLAKYAPAASLTGDLGRGRVIFEKTCASCHRLGGVGNDFGPKLVTLTDKSPANLLVAVLDPNRAVEAKYRGYAAVTADGRVLTGLVVRESSGSITLAGADGRAVEILRKDIEDLRDSGRSFMPEGLERDLSPQDFADVFAFVRGATE